MAWEKRGDHYYYYYRSVRRGGRVVKCYEGSGKLAEIVAKLDVLERQERRAQRMADQRPDEGLDEAEAVLVAMCEASEILARAALTLAGYHRHDRGPWRRRRR